MKKLLISLSVLALAFTASAQTFSGGYFDRDALRLTQLSLSGNARYVSMGGAFGALGGNSSAFSVNPAAIGIYKKSELSFTPALTIGQVSSEHLDGAWRDDDRWNFNISNFSLVGALQTGSTDAKDEWKFAQFGFTVNRLANFWSGASYSGNTATDGVTYLDVLTWEANNAGNLDDDFYRGMAYDIGLIYFDSISDMYLNDLVPGKINQRQSIRTSGGITEVAFTGGANYGDIFYLGASIGIPVMRYNQTKILTESAVDPQPFFNSWSLREELRTSGSGVNLKIGAIIRPLDFIRLGIAFHTPTFYSLTETFETQMKADATYASSRTHKASSTYDYSLRVPGKFVGSIGFVIGKIGLIGVEYERTNYSKMRFSDDDGYYDVDNDYISEAYKPAGTIRVGGEVRLNPLSLRAGYNYYESPYESNNPYNFSQHSFSGGIGFALGRGMTLDFAYCNRAKNHDDFLYPDYSTISATRFKERDHQFLVTLGFRF